MVRGDRRGSGVSGGARRVRLASRQRRRGRARSRLRPLRRHRRIRLATSPRHHRLLRLPAGDSSSSRLNTIRLSRDNIQLHPRRRTRLASSGPRLQVYSPFTRVKVKVRRSEYSSLGANPSQSYGASLVIWDHTVLFATRQR